MSILHVNRLQPAKRHLQSIEHVTSLQSCSLNQKHSKTRATLADLLQ